MKLIEAQSTATLELGGTKYPTAHLVFKHFKRIQKLIMEGIKSDNPHIVLIAEPMEAKFNKYWETMEDFASVTQIFDPRYKTALIEFLLMEETGSEAAAESIKHTKKILYDWFASYTHHTHHSSQRPTSQSAEESNTQCVTQNSDDARFKQYLAGKKSSQSFSPTSKLNLYLQEATVEIDPPNAVSFDLLSWWKVNSLRFPTLARLAKSILMIPMTSIASESAFSTSGRVLSDFRSKLDPETVEALICTQSWIKCESDDMPDSSDNL